MTNVKEILSHISKGQIGRAIHYSVTDVEEKQDRGENLSEEDLEVILISGWYETLQKERKFLQDGYFHTEMRKLIDSLTSLVNKRRLN